MGYKSKIISNIRELAKELLTSGAQSLQVPYLLLQTYVKNAQQRESKLIFFDGVFQYYNRSDKSTRPSDKKVRNDMELFAKSAIERLENHCPAAMTSGLFRVDVFRDHNDGFFVNEFESLDSQYCGAGKDECNLGTNLKNFWRDQLLR